MPLRSGGLVSGLDTNTLISQLVGLERQPIEKLKQRKAAYQTQLSTIGTLKSALNDLKAAAKKLDTANELLSMTGTSSSETHFEASATGDAAAASYSLDVDAIALAEKNRSDGFDSATSQVRQGTLSITVKGGDTQDITIESGDTLQDVVAKINDSVNGASASIISDGTSSYLSLTADETGHTLGGSASDAIEINESYGGGGGDKLQLSEIQTASNALLTLDGLNVESESNDVTSAITGVTIHVHKETSSTETLTIEPDKVAIEASMQAFVDAYNTAIELVVKETTVTAGTDRTSTLAGDATIRGLRLSLSQAVSAGVGSLSTTNYDSLSSIGITTETTGKLKLDSDKLQTALDASVSNVSKIFTASDSISQRLLSVVEPYAAVDGVLTARTDGINQSIKSIDTRISGMELRVQQFEMSLVRQFTALEMTVSQIQDQGSYLSQFL